MMTAAERFAALKTLEVAVKALASDAAEQAIQQGSDTGADRWRTEYGTVVIATRKDAPVIADEQGLVTWALEHAPSEVIQTVRPTFAKILMDRCTVDGYDVIDTTTGEVLPFAMVRQGTTYVTTPKSDAKDNTITRWELLLRERLDTILLERSERKALP